MRRLDHLAPLRRGQFVAREHVAHLSSRISAAVPGKVSSPFSFNIKRYSRIGMPVSSTPYTISMGEKAWACIFGVADFTARKMSR